MSNGNTTSIVCSRCTPEYCGCGDFYRGRLALFRGEYDEIWLRTSRRRIMTALNRIANR